MAQAYNPEDTDPKAVLIFDYCSDLDALKSEYMKQNPHVTKTYITRVKFLSNEVFELIKDVPSFAKNMYTVLLAW